jgi:DNA primase
LRPPSSASLKSLESATKEFEGNRHLASEYLQGRGIDPDTAARFRLGVVGESASHFPEMTGRLAIPGIGYQGQVYSLRFRSLNDTGPKYLGAGEVQTMLYNLQSVSLQLDEIHVTEGELDAVVLEKLGYHAVGVTGANNWKRHHPRVLAGFRKIYVWGDGDQAGRDFARKVCASLTGTVNVTLPPGHDVTSVYMEQGEAGIASLLKEDE